MSDLIRKGKLFNALANTQDKGDIFAVIQNMPVKETASIEKLAKEYYVMDDCGYTDREVVKKVNEVIEAVNMLLEEIRRC